MKKELLIFCLFIYTSAIAQKNIAKHTPVLQKGFYISFNPHGIFEPVQGAIGLGVGYRIDKHFELWSELSYLYDGVTDESDYEKFYGGFRSIISTKYFYNNKHGFFAGIEFRIKQYAFDDVETFINQQSGDILYNFLHKAKHTLIGGAAFWGKRFKITANGKFELEGNIGVGVKHRHINRKNIPSGYLVENNDKDILLFFPDRDIELNLPYFPSTVRLIYHL